MDGVIFSKFIFLNPIFSDNFDIKRLEEAAQMFVGYHDFRTFMSPNNDTHVSCIKLSILFNKPNAFRTRFENIVLYLSTEKTIILHAAYKLCENRTKPCSYGAKI